MTELEDIPSIRKSGMPKKWDRRKDVELRNHLLQDGFVSTYEKFGLTEDAIVKRFEMMFSSSSKPQDEASRN